MDKKELYEKAEKVLNQAYESAKQSIRVVSEKAGEAAHVTKLLVEKATLEHKISKKFTQIGSRLYERMTRENKTSLEDDVEIKSLVEEAKSIDLDLSQVEATIEKEQKEKRDKQQS